MKLKTKISITILLLLIAVLVHFYKAWIPILFWHITHKNPVAYHNVKVKVPFSWIASEDRNSIVLLSKDKKISVYITKEVTRFLDKDNVTEEDIELIKKRLQKMDAKLIGYGQIRVANKTGNFIDFVEQPKSNEYTRTSRKVITLPGEDIDIGILSAEALQENNLIILNNISFK